MGEYTVVGSLAVMNTVVVVDLVTGVYGVCKGPPNEAASVVVNSSQLVSRAMVSQCDTVTLNGALGSRHGAGVISAMACGWVRARLALQKSEIVLG